MATSSNGQSFVMKKSILQLQQQESGVKEFMMVHIMYLSIYGLRKIKLVNFLDLYRQLRTKPTWMDEVEFFNYKEIEFDIMINDNMDICARLSHPNYKQDIYIFQSGSLNLDINFDDFEYMEKRKVLNNVMLNRTMTKKRSQEQSMMMLNRGDEQVNVLMNKKYLFMFTKRTVMYLNLLEQFSESSLN